MAQDLGLISRRGVERLMRGDVDPDRLIKEAQHAKNMSTMDLYKKCVHYKLILYLTIIKLGAIICFFCLDMSYDTFMVIFSQRSKSRQRGEEQRRTTREKYNSDLIVPYNMNRMPVAKHKVYEVTLIKHL